MRNRLLLSVLLLMNGAGDVEADAYTDSEFLPAYCRHTKDGDIKDPAMMQHYERVFGHSFTDMHHYCRGLFALHEAVRITDNKMLRDSKYKRATSEFNYVLARSGNDFVLRPEILVKKGMAFLALGNDIEAVKCFREAISLRADYVPAYVALSNLLDGVGKVEEARRLIEAALKYAPDNPFLRQKLSEFGEPTRPSDAEGRLPD